MALLVITKPDLMETTQNKYKIFLVDDDKMLINALKQSLSDNVRLEIVCFHTGEECLQNIHYTRNKPDVVVLDYYLNARFPDAMNGIAVLKKIKKTCPQTEVIMLSSQDNMGITLDTLENGAYDYVIKGESAFLKIGNMIRHITSSIDLNKKYTEGTQLYNRINLFIILIFLLMFILSKVLQKG